MSEPLDVKTICRRISNICTVFFTSIIDEDSNVNYKYIMSPVDDGYLGSTYFNNTIKYVEEHGYSLEEFKKNYPFITEQLVETFFLYEFFKKHHDDNMFCPISVDIIAELFDEFPSNIQDNIEIIVNRSSCLFPVQFKINQDVAICSPSMSRYRVASSKFTETSFKKQVEKDYTRFIETIRSFNKLVYRFRNNLNVLLNYGVRNMKYPLNASQMKRILIYTNSHSIEEYVYVSKLAENGNYYEKCNFDVDESYEFIKRARTLALKSPVSPINFTAHGFNLKVYQNKNKSDIIVTCLFNGSVDMSTNSGGDQLHNLYLILKNTGHVDEFIGRIRAHALRGI